VGIASAGEAYHLTLVKPPALAVDPEEPFAADSLELLDFAVALSDLVEGIHTSFVINLEAPWGQGKSTFRKKKIQSLYFNAWETDFSSDPLIALIGELGSGIAALNVGENSPAGKQLKKLKKIGARVAIRAIPAAVKAATLGVLDIDAAVDEALAEAGEKLAEQEIELYETAKNSIASFRAELESLAKKISEQNSSTAPLVVVIDELDRCRPDYAIQVLETVKHLFTVPNVVFVIATDSTQLSNAIKHVYGLDAAADDYLRRFFDLALSLPPPSKKQFVLAQIQRFGLEEKFKKRTHPELAYDRDQTIGAFIAMFDATDCSLRDQEKCFTLLALAMRSVGDNAYLHSLLLCTLIVLRVKRRNLYDRFVAGNIGAKEVVVELSSRSSGQIFFSSDRGYGDVVQAYLIAAMARTKKEEQKRELMQIVEQDPESATSTAQHAKRILEILEHYSFRNAHGAMKNILPRIELFSRSTLEEDLWP
jgi:hypothetical protein